MVFGPTVEQEFSAVLNQELSLDDSRSIRMLQRHNQRGKMTVPPPNTSFIASPTPASATRYEQRLFPRIGPNLITDG